jgi:hypothetical protein
METGFCEDGVNLTLTNEMPAMLYACHVKCEAYLFNCGEAYYTGVSQNIKSPATLENSRAWRSKLWAEDCFKNLIPLSKC